MIKKTTTGKKIIFLFFFCLIAPLAFAQFYLLEQPIEEAILNGDFKAFREICTEKTSVNLEPPFRLKGYFYREKLSEKLTGEFSHFQAKKIEWVSLQVEEKFAIQSLNLILRNKRSGKETYYKFIFFLTKKKEWKLYNLRGLRIE
ncbi:MAG: hypothetical protein KAW12_03975 [Candidatus Aminicenantes bacterium]|nr:hypothetical protein [Candidatus Aminicenantes bacterium]